MSGVRKDGEGKKPTKAKRQGQNVPKPVVIENEEDEKPTQEELMKVLKVKGQGSIEDEEDEKPTKEELKKILNVHGQGRVQGQRQVHVQGQGQVQGQKVTGETKRGLEGEESVQKGSKQSKVSPDANCSRGNEDEDEEMSGVTNQEEDKKPTDQAAHINLKVKGQDGNEVFFRIKRSTQLKKLMTAYCDRQSVELNSIAFLFDGRRLRAEQTPDEEESVMPFVKDSKWEASTGLNQASKYPLLYCTALSKPIEI
ncbi:hypothetical protein L1049_001205 [Liquidambar formosana]|uniref:Ubiquitin-like domain-containing protein n=1 Tax=Liquidambar formosana TaxID=63359 RepID=A0AAP0NA73_LIQFO